MYSGEARRFSAVRPNDPIVENGDNEMAKGQKKTEKTNKPKLSPKEKKANKLLKKAKKAAS